MSTALDSLARKIDRAIAEQDATKLQQSLELIERLSRSDLADSDCAALELFSANALAALRELAGDHEKWNWIQSSLEQEIFHLRQALVILGDKTTQELKTDLRLRITTNLANALDHVGRFAEALELWAIAISEHQRFSMAIGNRALALFWYARYVQSNSEKTLLLRESHQSFSSAIAIGVEPHAQEHMLTYLSHLERVADWAQLNIALPTFRSGSSQTERRYRRWCVQNLLALSPINDISTELESIQDTLTLPPILVDRADATASLPSVYAIFNQLKQEYTSARFLVFEALEEKRRRLHFADRGVVLFDALDYRHYRLWIEKLKMAFLAAHAILDKTAYLVNEYWGLGLGVRSLSFNSVWYAAGNPKRGLNKRFSESRNWPLRGLYWLSRDFYYKPKTLHAAAPEAKVIHDIRNHVAHRYLRVHDHVLYDAAGERARTGSELSFPVSEIELQRHTTKLLKLVRSAMIYLSAAVTHEEAIKAEEVDGGLIMPMPVTLVGDRYRL